MTGYGGLRAALATQFEYTAAPDAQADVPEPADVALLGLGLAGVGFGTRRRSV